MDSATCMIYIMALERSLVVLTAAQTYRNLCCVCNSMAYPGT
jgi:hypothetical protein